MRTRPFRSTILLAVACVALSGCSVSLGGPDAVPASDLEKTTTEQFTGKDVADQLTSIRCDGDLEAKVGATQTCQADFESGLSQELTLEVDSVEGEVANFSYRPGPGVLSAEGVATQATAVLTEQGSTVDGLTCQDIPMEDDATSECSGTVDGVSGATVVASLSDVDLLTGSYSMTVEAS